MLFVLLKVFTFLKIIQVKIYFCRYGTFLNLFLMIITLKNFTIVFNFKLRMNKVKFYYLI